MQICKIKATKRIIGMTSDGTADSLIARAKVEFGLEPPDIEVTEVDAAGYAAAKAEDPVEIAALAETAASQALEEAKIQEIFNNLPTWAQVSDSIDSVTTIAGLRGVVKKIARVVYLLAKNDTA